MSSSSSTQTLLQSSTVLGKRKSTHNNAEYILHLASSPEPSVSGYASSDVESAVEKAANASKSLMIVNGAVISSTKRRYQCTFDGCRKSYTKPSRLAEHERSHTGERPYSCSVCQKSYLRESHQQAHARSHLPESSRPLGCPDANCEKRFWTSQHLKAHVALHSGEKPFQCTAKDCSEAFAKHHQLRAHICAVHAPPGTKAYQCYYGSCTKTFSTTQHLRAHMKTHDESRYTCIRDDCMSEDSTTRKCFATWTALQQHIRTAHPPTCEHPSCNGRVFSSQKGLRAHQKLHEQHNLEEDIDEGAAGSSGDEHRPRKRRRGGEIGRDWKCEVEGCDKNFKSKKALRVHTDISHLGKRDFVCPHEDCGHTFGYKHLLQRHLANIHSQPPPDTTEKEQEQVARPKPRMNLDIDTITGLAYDRAADEGIAKGRHLRCPYPDLPFELEAPHGTDAGASSCGYVFSRAYDLGRHLKAAHGVCAVKDSLALWVKLQK